MRDLEAPFQLDLSITRFNVTEIRTNNYEGTISKVSPDFVLKTGKVLQEVTTRCLKLITYIFNAIITLCQFPNLWKVVQDNYDTKAWGRPRNSKARWLVACLVKDVIVSQTLQPVLCHITLFLNTSLVFETSTEWLSKWQLVRKINDNFENRKYCSFLDVKQALIKL